MFKNEPQLGHPIEETVEDPVLTASPNGFQIASRVTRVHQESLALQVFVREGKIVLAAPGSLLADDADLRVVSRCELDVQHALILIAALQRAVDQIVDAGRVG